MLIIVYFYSDASLLSLIISPATGISRAKDIEFSSAKKLKEKLDQKIEDLQQI